ncbi:hypothetical protein ACHHYP_13089 [Achlya hypogyna]|uniref:Uncharacterized protein n=1 Tax=Achlya hypogyna TaxID=1202772 RepID=A0A1V9YG18_ACHHY|nr:hypothetical protein ACHHYP_13089 [Achlya hypogyna]
MPKKEEVKEVVVPVVVEPEKPKIPPGHELVFSVLSREDTEALLAASSPTDQLATLCQLLQVAHYGSNPRSRVWVDLCLYNLVFCRDARLSVEQTALFFAIMTQVFTCATTTSASLCDTFALLQRLLTKHSVDLPPDHVAIFAVADVERIVTYLAGTFFQHYEAYQLAFHGPVDFVRTTRNVVVETPLVAPPLADAKECLLPIDP